MHSLKPYIACVTAIFIWSGWITISRYGVHTALQPADITMLRYGTALLCVSPLLIRYKWNRFKLHQYLCVALGIGFPYTLVSFYGLIELKAAHGGVLVNGMLPVLGSIVAWYFLRQKTPLVRWVAIGIIFVSNLIMAGGGIFSLSHLTGILLLFSAALFYTIHMTSIRFWGFGLKDVLLAVPVINTLLFIPFWFILPTNIGQANIKDIIAQSIYQGVVVNIIALMCVTYAITKLGTVTVSIFMSIVPLTTAIIAWIFLGESLSAMEIAGILGCSLGLFLYSKGQHTRILDDRQRVE